MPKNWLDSKSAPDPPVLDWLKWTSHDLERHITSGTVAAIIGLNKMGDLQTIFSPIVIQNAFNNGQHSAIIGNSSNKSNEPAFIYTDASDIGSIMVVMTYDDIPPELRPGEPLSSRFIADTCWATAKVKLGMVQSPMFAPIFFGQKAVETSVHDADFEDKMAEISPLHLQWAKLMQECLTQEENDTRDIDAVIDHFSKSRNKENLKMVTPGFGVTHVAESTFLSVFTLPAEKWSSMQGQLREFFAVNPSPIRVSSRPPSRGIENPAPQTTNDVPTAEVDEDAPSVHFLESPPRRLPRPIATSSSANFAFDPMAFLKEWGDKMQLMHQQQPQTIVVESRADKSRESEAKFNNDMLRLLLISGKVEFTLPGSFDTPRIPTYTQAMKNILSHPSTVRSMHTVNILTTCFNHVPTDLAERLSPLTTHKSMQHISKNFASAFLATNFQRTPLDHLNFETSSITILSFVGQDNFAKLEAHREAEQHAKNEREFDFVEMHRKILKTTIEGLGMISGMECVVKICANVCCVVTAFVDIDGSNPVPLLYSVCIKTIDFVKSLDFIQWHAIVCARVPQLPFIYLNMLQQVLSQLAIYSTNTVNIGLVERGDSGANINIALPSKITKLVARFFEKMENHILEGSFPDTVPAFTPRDANPSIRKANVATSSVKVVGTVVEKSKADASPPGTPAHERTSKKQKLKKGAGSLDFTKAGLFHSKEGTPVTDLFPTGLTKKYCSFFCFHNKKCSKPHQACDFDHVGRWDKVPPDNQLKILEHCHAGQGKKVWLDADTFAKHKITIPDKFAYLLGDSEGPKSA